MFGLDQSFCLVSIAAPVHELADEDLFVGVLVEEPGDELP
jgi:hypothetical protein